MSSLGSWLLSGVLSYLLNSVWQVPLLFAAGWVAARALRRAGAAVEHRVWVTVLLLETLLPAVSIMRWDWLGRVLDSVGVISSANGTHVAVVMGAGTAAGGMRLSDTVLIAAALVYGATTAYFAARFLWSWRKLNLLRREANSVALADDAAVCMSECARRFGVNDVSIASSRHIFGPVTMGFRRKLVLLPTDMISGLPGADFQTALAHEFAHVRRNDYLKNLIYELLSLPVMYHPLGWLTRERVRESREIVCDQMAAEMSGRVEYARSLLRLASLLMEGAPARIPHAIGIFDTNFDTRTFERRIMRLTKKQFEIRGTRRLAAVIVCVAFGLATCGSALALRMQVNTTEPTAEHHSARTPRAISVSAGVMAGNRIGGVNPKYPAEAKEHKIQGTIVLKALISKDGSMEKVTVVSGPKELRKSAIDAVRTWKYKPYLLNGEPVQVTTEISVVYSLSR